MSGLKLIQQIDGEWLRVDDTQQRPKAFKIRWGKFESVLRSGHDMMPMGHVITRVEVNESGIDVWTAPGK